MKQLIWLLCLWGGITCSGQELKASFRITDKALAKIWSELNKEINSVSEFKRVNRALLALDKNKNVEKIPLLIETLSLEQVVGREESRLCDEAARMLQMLVPLEYEFSWKKFKESKEFRNKIKQAYSKWYESNTGLLHWNRRAEMFLTGKEEEGAIRKHRDWRMSLRW